MGPLIRGSDLAEQIFSQEKATQSECDFFFFLLKIQYLTKFSLIEDVTFWCPLTFFYFNIFLFYFFLLKEAICICQVRPLTTDLLEA